MPIDSLGTLGVKLRRALLIEKRWGPDRRIADDDCMFYHLGEMIEAVECLTATMPNC
jgi:hypothetical protein